ncbi:MAG: class I SAM-dependent methyltransferase [Acidobacteria bacterium]|nr:class I SAM-dependent methyltransferase [Acidobacteriota bacterium]
MAREYNEPGLYTSEAAIVDQFDQDFSAIYLSYWHPMLGPAEEIIVNEMFASKQYPESLLDAAAGTGSLCLSLARRGCKVTANELSNDMRRLLTEQANKGMGGQPIRVIEPGVPWRLLPTVLDYCSFDLVTCLGASLSHCDLQQGLLKKSLAGMAGVVKSGGYILVDCKRYSEEGWELRSDGTRRPTADSDPIEWQDKAGNEHKGVFTSNFSINPDRSLNRYITYQEEDQDYSRQWNMRFWPVGKVEVCQAAQDCGLYLEKEIPMGSDIASISGNEGGSARYDFLLFKKLGS